MQQVELGTVSHGTLRVQDLLPAFLDTLSQLDPPRYSKIILELDAEYQRSKTPVGIASYAGGYCKGLDLCDDDAWWSSERSDELLTELFDALDDLAPEGARFGSHVGDGSDFGFWAVEEDGIDVLPDDPSLWHN